MNIEIMNIQRIIQKTQIESIHINRCIVNGIQIFVTLTGGYVAWGRLKNTQVIQKQFGKTVVKGELVQYNDLSFLEQCGVGQLRYWGRQEFKKQLKQARMDLYLKQQQEVQNAV